MHILPKLFLYQCQWWRLCSVGIVKYKCTLWRTGSGLHRLLQQLTLLEYLSGWLFSHNIHNPLFSIYTVGKPIIQNPNLEFLPTWQKVRQAFLEFTEYLLETALISTANVQISDVTNSHLLNCRSFCRPQKAILHAAVSNNSQESSRGVSALSIWHIFRFFL